MYAIRAFTGLNGAGKTLSMVHQLALPAWAAGRPVVSNFRLYPERANHDPGLYIPLETVAQIKDLENCTLLLSEITACFPARQWASMASDIARVLDQLRKRSVLLGWDGPTWSRCDKNLRDVTQLVTVCKGRMPDRFLREATDEPVRFPPIVKIDGKRQKAPKEWPRNRLIITASYRREDFDEFTETRSSNKLKAYDRSTMWAPSAIASRCYDTHEPVMLLDHLADHGSTCLDCGGARRKVPCSCVGQPEARPRPSRRGAAADGS